MLFFVFVVGNFEHEEVTNIVFAWDLDTQIAHVRYDLAGWTLIDVLASAEQNKTVKHVE